MEGRKEVNLSTKGQTGNTFAKGVVVTIVLCLPCALS